MNNVTAPQQKDWSNATPAGLVALAVACFCFFALLSGKVQGSATTVVTVLGILSPPCSLISPGHIQVSKQLY